MFFLPVVQREYSSANSIPAQEPFQAQGINPNPITFHILTEDGKNITTEAGDKIRTE